MKKLTVKEILEHPELAQFIMPQNAALFVLKNKDYSELKDLISNALQEENNKMFQKKMELSLEEVMQSDNDVETTKQKSKIINDIFKENYSKISADKLMLYIGFTASRVLQALNRANTVTPVQKHEELFFQNGDYVVVNKNDIRADIGKGENTTIDDLRNKLARIVLISAGHFNSNNQKNKKFLSEISGTYFGSGIYGGQEKIRYNERELLDFARSAELITSMSNEGLANAISEGLTQKNILLKHIEKGKVEKKAAVDFMEYGVISEEDFIRKVYKKGNFTQVAEDPEVDSMTKLILFNNNKISLDTFKQIADFSLAFKAYVFKAMTIEEFQNLLQDKELEPKELSFVQDWHLVSVAYSSMTKEDVITDISEFLTHNIFDYTYSMEYLSYMQNRDIIDGKDTKYIQQLIQDFKTNELVNSKENEFVEVSGEALGKAQHYAANLTIDPQVRIDYLKSLGAVKKLRVRGETFIKDGEENLKKRNSLDGYEMFIIPSKKIAVLEKLYETTRDKAGNIQYRKNKNGELIPAVENATYIMPIEMAKEFTEKKNKKDLIKSPYVERSMHTADWAINTQRKISKIRPEVEFDKENTEKWSKRIIENYKANKEKNERGL